MLKPLPLRTLLFFVLTTLSVVPVLILGIQSEHSAMRKEIEAVKEKHLQIAQHLTDALERYARDVELAFRSVSGIMQRDDVPAELRALIVGLHFRHICLVDNHGRVLRALTADNVAPNAHVPPAVLDTVRPMVKPDLVSFTGVLGGPEGLPVIYLVRGLPGGQFALAALKTDYFIELQQTVNIGRNGHAAIVDGDGRVLAHPRLDWQLARKDLSDLEPVRRMGAGETGVSEFHSPAMTQDMIAGFSAVHGPDWGVMVPQPISELESSARGFARPTLVISLIGAAMAAILSWWLANYLARPVVAVTRAAVRVARGEPAEAVTLGRSAPVELGSLASSFNTMVGEVTRSHTLLRTSEARFRAFAETAADWFWETDAENRIVYLSERFEECTGSAAADLLGHRIEEVFGARIEATDLRYGYRSAVAAQRKLTNLELRWRRPDGDFGIQSVNGGPFYSADKRYLGYRGTGRDVTVAQQLSEKLTYQASHDDLTGLMNRREFARRVQQIIGETHRDGGLHALCFLDLDRFKLVNDTCGHLAGDELLRQLGEILKAHLRRGDLVARLGGDEFGVLLRECSLQKAETLAAGLRDAIGDFRFAWEGKVFGVGSSIGVVSIEPGARDVGDVLRQADAACYTAKEKGRNRVHLLRNGDEEQSRRQGELQWVHRLNLALEHGTLELYNQPIVPLHADVSDNGNALEVFVRLRADQDELVSASTLMAAAERYNLAPLVDRQVVARTLDWYRDHPLQARRLSMCAINLSGQSVGEDSFAEFLVRQVRSSTLEPRQICFEITETAAIASLASAAEFILTLKRLGCRFALDDFGTGLCSLTYLKTLPVDFLKIDGGFVRGIAGNTADQIMVRSINDMAHALGKQTIAESVESQDVMQILRTIDVDFVQGNILGAPAPLAECLTARTEQVV